MKQRKCGCPKNGNSEVTNLKTNWKEEEETVRNSIGKLVEIHFKWKNECFMLSYERTPLADKLIQSLDCGAIIKLKHLLFKRKLIEQTNKNRLNELCDNAVCNYL